MIWNDIIQYASYFATFFSIHQSNPNPISVIRIQDCLFQESFWSICFEVWSFEQSEYQNIRKLAYEIVKKWMDIRRQLAPSSGGTFTTAVNSRFDRSKNLRNERRNYNDTIHYQVDFRVVSNSKFGETGGITRTRASQAPPPPTTSSWIRLN